MRFIIVEYQDLSRWDVKSYSDKLKSIFPIERLGKYIYEHSEKIVLNQYPDEEFPILGVTNKNGVYFNLYQKGKNINQPYKKVSKGEMFYNPYRVNVGSIGIVQDEYEGFYTSPAYVVFGVKEDLYNEYINYILSSEWYNKILRASTSGSVRQNLTYELLSKLKIPIPDYNKQKKIIDYHYQNKNKSEQLLIQAEEREKSIEDFLYTELGIERKEYNKKKGPFVVMFDELERWDLPFFHGEYLTLIESLKKYKLKPLGRCAFFISRTWSLKDFPDGYFNYVQISDVSKEKGIFNSSKIDIKKAPSRATQIIKKNDLIISTTRPYLAAFSKVGKKYDNCVASSGFSVIRDTIDDLDKDFLLLFLKSNLGLKQFEQRMTGGLYPAIVQGELEKILIPLPPIEKQKEIVDKIEKLRLEAKQLKEEAEELTKKTKIEIEEMILGKREV